MISKSKLTTIIGIVALSTSLAACNKSATGQVAAVVNGEEISLQELNAELARLNLPESADKKAARQQVLQQIINRRLLAQTARDATIDRDPNFITQRRKMEDELLVRMYMEKNVGAMRVPDNAAIDKYIADHPQMFAQRKRYNVDQVRFLMPKTPEQLKALEGAHSLGDIITQLQRLGIPFERGRNVLDSAAVPPAMLQQVLNLPAGEPFIVPAGNMAVANVITGSEMVASDPAQMRPMAVQAMRNEGVNKMMEDRLKAARSSAKIDYQTDYAPPAGMDPATGSIRPNTTPANGPAAKPGAAPAAPATTSVPAPAAGTKTG